MSQGRRKMDSRDKRRLREYLNGHQEGEADAKKMAALIERLVQLAFKIKNQAEVQKRIRQLEDIVAS
jgi:hypothetical protein